MIVVTAPKIVCVGMPKTGTCSLGKALKRMGFSLVGWSKDYADQLIKGNVRSLARVLNEADACRDLPWCLIYRELDRIFPSSKFILTVRDEASWIKSSLDHFNADPANHRLHEATVSVPIRKWMLGFEYPGDDLQAYMEFYRRHNKEVMDYFQGQDKLLVMDLAKGDGWEKLCPFLGKGQITDPFPHVNRADGSE